MSVSPCFYHCFRVAINYVKGRSADQQSKEGEPGRIWWYVPLQMPPVTGWSEAWTIEKRTGIPGVSSYG